MIPHRPQSLHQDEYPADDLQHYSKYGVGSRVESRCDLLFLLVHFGVLLLSSSASGASAEAMDVGWVPEDSPTLSPSK